MAGWRWYWARSTTAPGARGRSGRHTCVPAGAGMLSAAQHARPAEAAHAVLRQHLLALRGERAAPVVGAGPRRTGWCLWGCIGGVRLLRVPARGARGHVWRGPACGVLGPGRTCGRGGAGSGELAHRVADAARHRQRHAGRSQDAQRGRGPDRVAPRRPRRCRLAPADARRSRAVRRLGAERGVQPGRHRGRHRRRRHVAELAGHLGQRGERGGALRAAGQVGGDPCGPAAAELPLGVQRQGLRVHVPTHDWSSPSAGGETRGTPGWFRRCASCGSSRARPRAHRLFTVPGETPRISAVSATE